MKLSVIIPVYKTERTLSRCVSSVLSQSWSDLEVILVDDGSPDGSPALCDEMALRDSRIRVIHKVNGGLSDARNSGIDAATGDYLTFVDSDDYLGADTLASLMQLLAARREIDLLEYPIEVFYGSPRHYRLDFPNTVLYSDMETYWYEGEAYNHSYACNKIFRATIFDHVRFVQGIVFEDSELLPRLLRYVGLAVTTGLGTYYYCDNPSGITQTADGQALQMLLAHHLQVVNTASRNDVWFQRYYMSVLDIQIGVFRLAGSEPQLPFCRVNPMNVKGKSRVKALLLNVLGVRRLCSLIKLYYRYKTTSKL